MIVKLALFCILLFILWDWSTWLLNESYHKKYKYQVSQVLFCIRFDGFIAMNTNKKNFRNLKSYLKNRGTKIQIFYQIFFNYSIAFNFLVTWKYMLSKYSRIYSVFPWAVSSLSACVFDKFSNSISSKANLLREIFILHYQTIRILPHRKSYIFWRTVSFVFRYVRLKMFNKTKIILQLSIQYFNLLSNFSNTN